MKKLFLILGLLGLFSSDLFSMGRDQAGDPVFQGNVSEEVVGNIEHSAESFESDSEDYSENDPADSLDYDSELDDFIDVIFGAIDSSNEVVDSFNESEDDE